MDSKDVEDVFKGVLSPDSSTAMAQPGNIDPMGVVLWSWPLLMAC